MNFAGIVLAVALGPSALGGIRPIELLHVGPIELGMSEADAIRILGKPKQIVETEGFSTRTFRYRKISLYFDDDAHLVGLDSTDPAFCLDGWACLGDDFSKVRVSARAHDSDFSAASITVHDDGCWAILTPVGGALQRIELRCMP